jgi:type IV pilus assembly protein PilA
MHAGDRAEAGFTVFELLVVVLILGFLAALAIPAFLSQTEKASGAEAKFQVRQAEQAMETYVTDRGTYASANTNPPPDPDSLLTIEPTLADPPTPIIVRQTQRAYTLRATSLGRTPVQFNLRHTAASRVIRTCTPRSTGGCNSSGTW